MSRLTSCRSRPSRFVSPPSQSIFREADESDVISNISVSSRRRSKNYRTNSWTFLWPIAPRKLDSHWELKDSFSEYISGRKPMSHQERCFKFKRGLMKQLAHCHGQNYRHLRQNDSESFFRSWSHYLPNPAKQEKPGPRFRCLDISFCCFDRYGLLFSIPKLKISPFLLITLIPIIFGFVSICPPADLLLDQICHS